MANSYFRFKQFTVHQDRCAMKVTTDSCLFGAWCADRFGHDNENALHSVLDVGTGTGLLSLMFAQKSNAGITAIELDADACEQARDNFAASPWHEKLQVSHIDARQYQSESLFDLIISNPPFYENELKGPDNRRNLAHHSESLLLPGVLKVIERNLEANGRFALLLPYKRIKEITQLFSHSPLKVTDSVIIRQSVKHDPFRLIIAGGKNVDHQTSAMVNEISVWDENQEYTWVFKTLLRDYYLAL